MALSSFVWKTLSLDSCLGQMTFNHVKGFDQNKTIHMVNIIFL